MEFICFASMNLTCDLLVLVRLFTDLKVSCVLLFFALITVLKNLQKETRVMFSVMCLICIKRVELFAVRLCLGDIPMLRCSVTKLFTNLNSLGSEAIVLFSSVNVNRVELFAVRFCLGDVLMLRCSVTKLFTNLNSLGSEAIFSSVSVRHSCLEET